MRLLFLTQFYPPEVGATQNRVSDLAERLARAGHAVTVVTALPNYPKGKIFEGYRGRLWMEDSLNGVRILRVWTYATNRVGVVPRVLSYISFTIAAAVAALLKGGDHDVLYVESPPLFLGIAGILISRLRKSRLLFNVTDLWPASAVALGILRNPTTIRLATWLERFIYDHCDVITGQTEGIIENIRPRDSRIPVVLVMNGVSPEAYMTRSNKRDRVREELNLGESFVVGYAGRHGVAQGLVTVLEAAKLLKDNAGIQFIFFGDGPEKTHLAELSQDMQLPNVRFFPPRPAANMPDLLSSFDAAVVPLKDVSLFRNALPCKLFECMAAGIPVVLAIDGEARRLVERANGGIPIAPEDPHAMADAILTLARDPELRRTMGEDGRSYVLSNCSRQQAANTIERLFLESTLSRA